MATPTTTIETIRNNIETVLRALTPPQFASVKYRINRDEEDSFRAWAEKEPQSSFRRYSAEQVGETSPTGSTGLDLEEVETEIVITVAYPNELTPSVKSMRQLRSIIDSDAMQIRDSVGHGGVANWVSGQTNAIDAHSVELGETVSFLLVTLQVSYYRSITT